MTQFFFHFLESYFNIEPVWLKFRKSAFSKAESKIEIKNYFVSECDSRNNFYHN